MGIPVIVDAARTPFGKRGGDLAGVHPAILLAEAQRGVLDRLGLDPELVEQVIGGCVTQAGEQSASVTRNAWLHAGLPAATGASTIDSQCSSAQQSLHLITALVAADVISTGVACGVESMSRVPLYGNITEATGRPRPDYLSFTAPTQFEAADRIADLRGLRREDIDAYGLRSQQRAAHAWESGYLDPQIIPVRLSCEDGSERVVTRDQGLRETSMEALAGLKPVREGGLHTAGTSSQITDGASVAVVMDERLALAHGLRPRARIRAQGLVGGDQYYLLDGPVQATAHVLERAGMKAGDIDLWEVNEAFASVPLSLMQVYDVDPDRMNVNGGAIALGHPIGASGLRLIATALDELERTDGQTALVSVCAGGGLASGAVLERI
jgi:acetyl-CoA C-acetyltransferase